MNNDLSHSGGEVIIHLLTDAARLHFALDVYKVVVDRSSSTPVLGLLARVAFIALTSRYDVSSDDIRDLYHIHKCQDAMLQLLMDGPSELMERLIELDICTMASSDYHEQTRIAELTTIGSEFYRYTDKSCSMECGCYALLPALLSILDRLLLLQLPDHRSCSSSSSISSSSGSRRSRDDEYSSIAPILVSCLLTSHDDMMQLHSDAMIYYHRQLNHPCFQLSMMMLLVHPSIHPSIHSSIHPSIHSYCAIYRYCCTGWHPLAPR